MNKTYRVVYNETTRTYTAVAEIATARGKSAGVVDGTVSAQTTVRKPKGRMIAGWTLGAALLNFSMMFGFTMLPAAEVVAATCTMNAGATTGAAAQVTSLACGVSATAGGAWSVANGANAQALGGGSTAEGFAAVAGQDSTAIGTMAAAGYNPVRHVTSGLVTNLGNQTGNQAVALGYKALAYGDQSLAIGGDTVASGVSSVAIGGDDLDRLAENAGLQDTFTKLSGEALNVGTYKGTTSSGAGSVAVGVQAESGGAFATTVGTRSVASGAAATAMGVASTAAGSAAFAGAAGSKALGNSSVAVGAQADATALNAIAIGQASQATASNATALGSEALATAVGASALGLSAKAQAENGVALGVRANVATTGVKGVAIGEDATSSNEKSIALGASSKSSGDKSIAIGDSANATNTHSFAIGGQSLSTGTNAMAIGSNAQATGNFSVAQGNAAKASAEQAQAMGVEAVASAVQAVAIGPKAQATSVNTFAGGVNALASGQQAVAIGSGSKATANNTIALGNAANASGANAIATGVSAKAAGGSAIASGNNANAAGNNSLASGTNAIASQSNAIATGNGAQATGFHAVSVGAGSVASGAASVALGQNVSSSSANTVAIGTSSNVTAASGVAIGQNAKVESTNATALGMGATVGAGFERAVALGSSSSVSAAVPTDSATVGDLIYSGFEGKAPEVGDVVSVGNGTRKRQIQNVAAGRINATSTDAINGSQLYATNVVLGNLATSVKNEFGGDAALNPNTGEITFSNIGNTGKGNIHDAIAAVKENVVAGTNIVSVTSQADTTTGATTYTVNAKGTTASSANQNYVTVTPGQPNAENITDYAVDLSDSAKASLAKADTAVQNIASPDGSVIVSKAPNDPNTTNLQVNRDSSISVDANGRLGVATVNLVQSGALNQAGTMKYAVPRGQQGSQYVTAANLATHLNNAGFHLGVYSLDGGVSSDETSGVEDRRIRTGDTLTMTAGKGMNIKQVDDGYEFAVDSAEVGVAGNKATVPTDSDNKMATVGSVAKAINESGFTLKTSANGGEKLTSSNEEVINPADAVEMIAGKNLTVQQGENGKITYATKENVEFTSVNATSLTAGPVTINNNGIDAGNKQITNVTSGGDVDTNAANIADVKTAVAAAKEKVIAGTNVASVVEGTEDGRTTFTVNAKGTTVSEGSDKVKVVSSQKADNVTDFAVDLSDSAKASLAKADTAVQNFKVAVNGADIQTVSDGQTVKFVNGTGTTARAAGENITFDVNFDNSTLEIKDGKLNVKSTAIAQPNTYFHANGADSIAGGDADTNSGAVNTIAGAVGAGSVAAGEKAKSESEKGIAIGYEAKTAGKAGDELTSWALNTAGELENTAAAGATGAGQIAIGQGAKTGTSEVDGSISSGSHAIAIGSGASTEQSFDIAIGGGSMVKRPTVATNNHTGLKTGAGNDPINEDGTPASVAIGFGSRSGGAQGDVVIGAGASSALNTEESIAQATVIGSRAMVFGDQAVAVGADTRAIGHSSVAIGGDDIDKALEALAAVEPDLAEKRTSLKDSITLADAQDKVNDSNYPNTAAIGHGSLAIGTSSQTLGVGSVATGMNAIAEGHGSVSMGMMARSGVADTAHHTIAIGTKANASGSESIALGKNAAADKDNAVALGAGSTTANNATAEDSATVNGITYSGFAGDDNVAAGDQVSVGAAGQERQIKNVAPGKISADSTDAINGSQLYMTQNVLGNVANSTKNILGGDATVANDGNITMSNIGDTGKNTVHEAIKASKEEVKAGTNIVDVVKTEGSDGQSIYTVNAKGTTVSEGSDKVKVVSSPKADNVTDFAVDLSDSAKASLAKADTAVQNFKVAVNGADIQTVSDGQTVKFVNGTGTTARADGENITFDVNKAKLSTDTTGNVTSDKTGDNFVTGEDVANAINEAAKLTEKTTTVVAGSNTHVQSKVDGNETEYTVSADKATVSVSEALKMQATPTTDGTTEAVTTDYALDLSDKTKEDIKKGVDAKEAVDNKGLTFTGDSGSTNVEKLGSTVAVNGDTNIVTSAQGDQISIKLKDDITVNSVTANNTTTNNLKVNPNGNVDMGGNQITNVASGGDVDTNAANIGDVKTAVAAAKEKVIAGTNVASVVEGTEDGRTTFTVNAKGTTASSANQDYVTVKAGAPNGENVTDYAVDLSEKAKASLSKADTAVQSFTTSVNGAQAEELNQANKDVNFVNGTGTTARNIGGDITFDVNKSGLTTDDKGNVTANNTTGDNFATAEDVANTINEATARTEKTTSVVKGSNTHVQEKVNGNNTEYTVSADKATVSVGSALTKRETPTTDATTGAVTTDYNIDLSDETKKQIAKEESVVQGDNVTVTEDGTNSTGGKQFKVALNKNVDLTDTGSVTTGNTTVNNDGVKVGGNTLTNAPITVNGNAITNVNEAINKTAEQAFNPLTFAGDSGTEFNRKLGEKVNVKGGADEAKLSDGNIGVVANGADTLEVKLSKELKDLTSAEFKDPAGNTTVVNGAGTTITPANGNPVSLTTTGLNNGGNQITNVASGGDVNTNAANIGDVKAAKTEVAAGTNIVDVVKTKGGNEQDIYTVNAKGTTASVAQGDKYLTVSESPKDGNVTDYQFGLTQSAKDSLFKADTALQSFTTSVNGTPVETINQENSDVGFVNGNVTTAAQNGRDITFDVNFDDKTLKQDGNKLAANTTTLTPSTDGTVTAGNADNLATAGDIANAINKAGFKLTATKSAGEVEGTSEELVNAGETVTIDAGKNIKLTQAAGKITVATKDDVEFNNVTVNGDVTAGDTVLNKDGLTINNGNTDNKPVTLTKDGLDNGGNTITNVARGEADTDAVNVSQLKEVSNVANAGWNLTAQGENSSNVAANDTVDLNNTDGNIVVSKEADQDDVTFNLAKDIKVDSVTIENGNAGKPVTLGKDGLDNGGNKVTNVADGDVTADSQDAVNGSQLFNNAQSIANNLGGGSTVNNDGTVSAPSYTVTNPADGSNRQVNNVGDAVDELNKAVNSPLTFAGDSGNNVERKLGTTLNVKGGATGNLTDNNIAVVADGTDTLNIKLAEKVDLGENGEVKAGDTTVNNDGVKVGDDVALNSDGLKAGDVSVTTEGINAGDKVISNVAEGKAPTDAVNLSQLKEAKEVVKSEDKSVTVNTTQNNDGANVFDLSVNVDGTTITKGDNGELKANTTTLTPSETDGTVTAGNPDNLATAGDIANAINKAGFKLTATASEGEVAGTSPELVNAGETVTIDAGKNIKLTQAAGKITVATKDNVEFNNVTVNGDVTAGDTVLNKDGVKNGDTSLTKDGITVNNGTAGEPVTLTKDGLNNGGNKVTNVADGDITADSKDAVNGSQLHDIIEKGFKIAADQGSDDTVKLGETVAYRSESGNIVTKVSDNKIDFDLADKITVGNNTANPVTIDGTSGTVTGLSNKTWDPNNIVSGQAATEDQLKQVSDVANAGWNLTANGENRSNVAANDTVDLNNTDGNIDISKKADEDKVTFNLAKDITVDSVTAGDSKLTSDGLTINNGTAGNPVKLTKDGLDNGGNKVTNVADGTENSDAVNLSQLKEAKEVVKSEDKSVTVNTTQNNDGANVFDLSVNVDGTTITKGDNGELKANTTTLTPSETDGTVTAGNPDNLATAGDIANAINKAGFKLTATASEGEVAGTSPELVNAGETVTIDAGKNIKLTQAAGKITVATKDNVEFNNVTVNGDVKAGETTLNKDGVKVGDTTLTKAPITVNGNTVNNVNDAINQTAAQAFSPLTFAGDSGNNVERKLGTTLNVKGGATGNLTDNNIAVVANGTDTLDIKLAEKVDLGENGEVKAGDTTVNNDGVKVGDKVSLTQNGLDNGNNQIKNVAEGTEDTDAVNVSQLKDAQAAATTKVEGTEGVEVTSENNADGSKTYTVAAKTDGTTIKVENGNITANTTKLENSDKGTVNTPENPDALATAGDIANAINNAGFNVKSGGNKADGDEAAAELVKAGEEVELNAGKNLKVKRTGKVFTFETADDVSFNNVTVAGDLTAGDTVLNKDGITINNGTAGNPVKLGKDGLDNGGNKITNVAEGTEDTDAVNVSQLKDAQAAATTKVIEGDNIKVTSETNTDGSTTYKVETAKDVKFDSVTTGDTVMNNEGVKVGNTTLTKAPITVNGNTVNNVNDAINQTAAQAFSPLTFAGDSGNNVERKLGTTLNVKGGATGKLTDNNIAVVANGTDTLDIKLAEKVDLGENGEVKAGDTTVNNDGVKVGDNVALTSDGLKAGDVSVTDKGLDNGGNQIKNVAAGTEDTDGVNVSQLKAAQAAATTKVVEGDNMVVTSKTNDDGSTTYTVATAKEVKFDKVTTGDTVMNNDGVTVGDNVALNSDGLKAGDVSVTDKGLDNGGNQIKNVAAGTEDTDGVNVSQLKAAQAAATTVVKGEQGVTVTPTDNADGSKTYTVAAKTDGTTIKVENGNITANTTKLDNDAKGAVNAPAQPNALATAGDIANAINNAGFTAKANGDAGELINAGEEVNFNNGDNIKVTRSGSDFTIATAKDVKFDSVTAPTVQLGDNGPKITNNGGNVNVAGNNGAPTKITGVKAGEAPTDAVNVSQLNAAQAAATTKVVQGKNMVVTPKTNGDGSTTYTVATADDLNVNSVTAGNTTVNGNGVTIAAPTEGNPQNTVSLSPVGLNNGGNTITNVAPGVNDTDAANVGQLKAVGNQLGNRINQVDADGKAGVAQAMATAGLPQAYLPGKSMMAVGGGVYRGETGYAVGFSSISDGGNWIIKGTASGNSRGHYGATAAVGYQW